MSERKLLAPLLLMRNRSEVPLFRNFGTFRAAVTYDISAGGARETNLCYTSTPVTERQSPFVNPVTRDM